jgi:hypothetical protein
MTWDIPKEYLDVDAEKERIDKKLKKQTHKDCDETTTDILGRQWVKHSTGTEFQEDYLR